MPGNQPESSISVSVEQLKPALETLGKKGLWDASEAEADALRRLPVFGGSDEAPVPLARFRGAFRDFLKANEELEGAIADMAIRLFGVEQPFRDNDQKGRLTAVGEVEWQGGTRGYESVRKRGGQRDQVLDRVATAIVRADVAARTRAASGPMARQATSDTAKVEPIKVFADGAANRPDRDAQFQSEPRSGSPRRRFAAVGAVVLIGLAIWSAFGHGADRTHVPPMGSIIDASTGHLHPSRPSSQSVSSHGAIEGGNFVRACDAAITRPCDFAAVSPVARPGDILSVQIYLKNRFNSPISLMKVSVRWEKEHSFLSAAIAWPDAQARLQSVSDSMEITFTDHNTHRLTYVPESSALYVMLGESTGNRLARLPEGIMEGNEITLENFGPPASCFDCIATYARIITLSLQVD